MGDLAKSLPSKHVSRARSLQRTVSCFQTVGAQPLRFLQGSIHVAESVELARSSVVMGGLAL